MDPTPNYRRSLKVYRGMSLFSALLVAASISIGGTARGMQDSTSDVSSKPIGEAKRWFEDARLGLHIHWGLDSLLGKGASVMEREKLPIEQYEKLLGRFTATRFNAESWVLLAKAAGANYLSVDAKRPDGFCLFDSKLTPFDATGATPYARDPLKDLAEACRKHQIRLFLNYSVLDWHHPDYFPRGKTGRSAGRPDQGEWPRYLAYYQGQIRELCTKYGEIGGIRLEGFWDRPDADWDLASTYRIIRELQPGALIGIDPRTHRFEGADFWFSDQSSAGMAELLVKNVEGRSSRPGESGLPIAVSENHAPRNAPLHPLVHLLRGLLDRAGEGTNTLLVVNASPDGAIAAEPVERLKELGNRLKIIGPAFYKTRKGPIPPASWGVSLAEGSSSRPTGIFLHVDPAKLKTPLVLPMGFEFFNATLLGNEIPLMMKQVAGGFELQIPEGVRTEIDTVVILRPTMLDR